MIGTILNATGIVLGGLAGLLLRKQLAPATQFVAKSLLGVFTVYVGLKMTWTSLGPGFWLTFKELAILILALTLGRLTGQLLHIQKALNHAGRYAKQKMTQATPGTQPRFTDGFITCTILFCLAPMAILGAVQDGLTGYWQTLGLKALIDGFAAMTFAAIFGRVSIGPDPALPATNQPRFSLAGFSIIFSAIPVLAYQGTLTLSSTLLAPFLRDYSLMDSVNATAGMLVFCVALIILELKKIELADYLPSLAFAPLITWLWK